MRTKCSAEEALERLRRGNLAYLRAQNGGGDVSPALRERLFREGQSPYAVVIACSDSRVVPEAIFSAGLGELFVIRTAGNVAGEQLFASVEYAVLHLGCRLVVVLGHEDCGAVNAALKGESAGYAGRLAQEIAIAIGGEKDACRASLRNAERTACLVREMLRKVDGNVRTVVGMYRLSSGRAEFFDAEEHE